MADSFTPNLNLRKPEVGAAFDTWGGTSGLNSDLDILDALFNADGTGTGVGLASAAGKVWNAIAGTLKATASRFLLVDATDNTKVVQFDASGLTTGQTRTFKLPDLSDTLATTTSVQAAVTARLPTGTKLEGYYGGVAPAGFVLACGRTIGPTGSAATERANNDTQALYVSLWGQGFVPSGGAGANALADWAANKPIPLPDYRSATSVGKDNLGGTAKGLIPAATDPKTQVGGATASGTVAGTTSGNLSVTASGSNFTNTESGDTHDIQFGNNSQAASIGHNHFFSVTVFGSATGSLTVAGTASGVSTVQPSNVVDVILAL